MTRRYSPNHPAVKSSPQVMTAQAWSKLYRRPLAAVGAGFIISLAGLFLPAVAFYGWPISIIWCLPGAGVCLAGFARCQSIYELEREFDK